MAEPLALTAEASAADFGVAGVGLQHRGGLRLAVVENDLRGLHRRSLVVRDLIFLVEHHVAAVRADRWHVAEAERRLSGRQRRRGGGNVGQLSGRRVVELDGDVFHVAVVLSGQGGRSDEGDELAVGADARPMAWTSGTEISVNDGPCSVAACPRLIVLPSIEIWSSVSVLPSSTLIWPMETSTEPLSMLEPATSSVPAPPISPPSIVDPASLTTELGVGLDGTVAAGDGAVDERYRAAGRGLDQADVV